MYESGSTLTVEQAMDWAITLAQEGRGCVAPNPVVGCVVLSKNNQLLSSGYHQRCGGDHAEVDAINKVKNKQDLEGAKVVVTLEPCAFEGKTPACAKILSDLPIGEVYYGAKDPYPKVSGKGVEILKKAGKKIELLKSHESACKNLAEVFFINQIQQRPFIALKVATSLDGKIALKNGESQWITGKLSRIKAHELRFFYDAVLVGKKTLEKDNPSLNIRHPKYSKENKVIIASSSLKAKLGWDTLQLQGSNFKSLGFKVGELHKEKNIYIVSDIKEQLKELYKVGVTSILVEGGSGVLSYLLKEGLFDKLYCFVAPAVIGQGLGWSDDIEVKKLSEKVQLKKPSLEVLGQDILLEFRK